MAYFQNFGVKINDIVFIRHLKSDPIWKPSYASISEYGQNIFTKCNFQSLSLLYRSYNFNIFEFMPRTFTISTNNESSNFNIEMLKSTSSVISKFLQNHPQSLQYHIDIKDEENVLQKFEQMYQGKIVTFDEDELPISQKITKILNITNCPNFMKPESLKTPETHKYGIKQDILSVEIDKIHFNRFLLNNKLQTFKIITNKKEYECNKYGVYASVVIRELLVQDPTLEQFTYEFDDEFSEFQSICDLFNFKSVTITKNSIEALKFIAEDLQINYVINDINKYIEDSEKVSKTIDEEQTIINNIDELFDLLYHIKEKSVETVKNEIVESCWSKTIENVQELAAFILQVIKSEIQLHPFILELLIQLDKEANEENNLDILIQFVVKQLLYSSFDLLKSYSHSSNFQSGDCIFDDNRKMTHYSFIYKLYRKGIISKDDLYSKLKSFQIDSNCNGVNNYFYLAVWFLPELAEINQSLIDVISSSCFSDDEMRCNGTDPFSTIQSFMKYYWPDKIDLYKRMRDMNEPDDELTKALRNDDVDTFQSIISKMKELDVTKCFIPFNIFEIFTKNGEMSYINYAAAYGSVKCFKYILLNHDKVRSSTFQYAVYGGNIEIIKIVAQQTNDDVYDNDVKIHGIGNPRGYTFGNHEFINTLNNRKIIPSIVKHRNDLFDWIFESNFVNDDKKQDSLYPLLLCSVKNGNAHSMVEIIDNGFDLFNNSNRFIELIRIASENGFYNIVQFLLNFMKENSKSVSVHNYQFSVYFGNLSIFKMFIKMMKQNDFQSCLSFAVHRDYINIIHFFFETLLDEGEFHLIQSNIIEPLKKSLEKETNDIFNYIMNKIKIKNPTCFNNFIQLDSLLEISCNFHNIEAAKKITDIILEYDPMRDFTKHFVTAAKTGDIIICHYFIENKASINYEKLSSKVSELGSINEELFSMIGSVSPEAKDRIFGCINEAIGKKNKSLVEYLLKNNSSCDNALFEAVSTNDLEIVDIVLKYKNKPSFINKKSLFGTALQVAVSNNNLPIVKRLLSLPGINPSLYCYLDKTPLIVAIGNLNLEIMKAIIDFYGDDIQNQKWQFEKGIDCILQIDSNPDKKIKEKSQILKYLLEIKCINPSSYFSVNTLLTFACQANDIDLVKYLLQFDQIDVNLYESIGGNTPFIIAVQNNNFDIVKLLIDNPKTNINSMNYDEQTALIIAVVLHHDNIIDIIINNEKFDPEESRLNYAFFVSTGETSKKLLSVKSLDVNYKSIRNMQNKHDIIGKKKIRNNKYNSIQSNKKYGTALTNAVDENNFELVDLIIQHPSFDKYKSLVKVALAKAVYKNKLDIMKKLLKVVDNDVNICDIDGHCLLSYAVMNLNQEVINEILNNETFDSKKNNLLQIFVMCYSNRNNDSNLFIDENSFSLINKKALYENGINNDEEEENREYAIDLDDEIEEQSPIDVMNILFNFDNVHEHLIDFTKLLPNGKSFFTEIQRISKFNGDIVDFLLDHGVDPNEPDKFGVYPLEKAIQINSKKFVVELLNSNLIDFTKKIPVKYNDINNCAFIRYNYNYKNGQKPKFTSYMHLAVISNREILQEFLVRQIIDINIENDLGETPLMMACRFKRKESIRMLFQMDGLDYLHKNKDGKNALDIVSHSANSSLINEEQIEDKTAFLDRLLKCT